ncbi:ABC transporter ATP-binding protein [uncultured Algibacter sp.]|uniref:ABC transporter ATP-binding protein n=1 Tax=uncultured Algibacter sp. TaxID=298659 RepID=UPI0026126186|nr:ABC transporter ATP-binding protein [uncultured Algibacter sp.]
MQEDKEVLIKVEHLSKKFCKDLKTSLWYGVKDLYSNITGNFKERALRPKEFWAVKDISFELRRGECLGLIGHNGAGKSTLLKILNGLINPDEGKITIKGKVGALIELGAGFNPILTGRENIYNNGAVLGFTRKEIDTKIEDIIDFSEIREFIDMPIQNYSSGMKVRLGFSIAAQMEPDVLIIDEVLAVGDLGFVLKCFKTIDAILPNTAIVFVSHNMPMVSRICTEIILMEHGNSQFQGNDVGKAIDLYYQRFTQNDSNIVFDDKRISLLSVNFSEKVKTNNKVGILNWGEELVFCFEIKFNLPFNEIPYFKLIFLDKELRGVASVKQDETFFNKVKIKKDEKISFNVSIDNLQLSKGIYSVNLMIVDRKREVSILRCNNILSFQIIGDTQIWQPFLLDSKFQLN